MNRTLKDWIKVKFAPLYLYYSKMKYEKRVKEVEANPEAVIKKQYRERMGKDCELDDPVMYTDKIQKLKLELTDQFYSDTVDKVKVRDYLTDKFGKELEEMGLHFTKWYGVYDTPDQISYESFPDKFVLKTNHACGQVIICEDKNHFDKKLAAIKLRKWIGENYYYVAAESNYKFIKPKIICEEYMGKDMVDYRIFCFHGEPYITKVTNRDTEHDYKNPRQCTYFNDWTKVPFTWDKHYGVAEYKKPDNWEQMLDIARKLSQDYDLVRVDLYNIGGLIYFGELTLTPNSGLEVDLDDEWNRKLGDMLNDINQEDKKMNIMMLKSKIHRAVVTQAELNYVGSITVDRSLMDAAGIEEYEKVLVVDVENGSRFETYVIEGERDSGIICLNGAAARLVQTGDHVIIMSFCSVSADEAKAFKPTVVFVGKENRIDSVTKYEKHGELVTTSMMNSSDHMGGVLRRLRYKRAYSPKLNIYNLSSRTSLATEICRLFENVPVAA